MEFCEGPRMGVASMVAGAQAMAEAVDGKIGGILSIKGGCISVSWPSFSSTKN
jgi:hypothetical protein